MRRWILGVGACAIASAPHAAQVTARDEQQQAAVGLPPVTHARRARGVSIAGFRFTPSELTVVPGDTVVWTNEDPFRHTTTSDSGAWSSPELARGERFVVVPARAGQYPYHCTAHPSMRGLMTVRE